MATEALPLRQRAEQLAASLPPLLVAAERVAATIVQGVHGRRRVGQGETFWQYRHYTPGDTPQLIDWRQSAKSDHVFVRELEWEAAQSVWLWCDRSPSMSWSSSANLPEKKARAELLILSLASLLLRGGEHVALLGSGRRPVGGRGALTHLAHGLSHEVGGDGADLPPIHPLPRSAQVVLMGDFLAPLDQINKVISDYAEHDIRGHLLQVLDPAEESLPYTGRVRFEGLEGEEFWLLSKVESVRGDYQSRLKQQRDALSAMTRAAGWTFGIHHTDRSPQSALLALYTTLSRVVGK